MAAWLLVVVSLATAVTAGCTGAVNESQVTYKPPVLPVKLEVTSSGVKISGDATMVTFLGTFSVGAKYALPSQASDVVRVLVLDRSRPPTGFHEIFDVRTGGGEFVAVTNGTTVIRVVDRRVEIDVTDGTVEEITFRNTAPDAALPASESAVSPLVQRWRDYWAWAPYEPFAFSRWAYDDSTLGRWYGVGFGWFLLRLVLALVLSIFDVLLTALFLLAGVCDVLFGETARNVVLGVGALLFAGTVVLGAAVARDV